MNRTEREDFIQQLREIEARLSSVETEWKFSKRESVFGEIQNLKLKIACIKSHIATDLPITVEGYLGEDEEEVDQNERGCINEIYHYLGCPVFPNGSNKHYGSIKYDELRDITEMLKQNTGKFLRITIEQIPLGDGENCNKCENKFRCLTTKVKA